MSLNLKEVDIIDIISIVVECGEFAKKCFLDKNFKIYNKHNNSKVTSVDIEISNKIYEFLNKKFPKIPIICEERSLRNIESNSFFLIDPIDGTSSFVNNSIEFCINIALIYNLEPIFGIIYAPLFEDGKLAYNDLKNNIILKNFSKNNTQIISNLSYNRDKINIIASPKTNRDDINRIIANLYPNYLNNYSIQTLSSAVKFFRLIENEANLYIHLKPTMEWDIASGDALIRLLGFNIFNLKILDNKYIIENKLKYKKSEFLNNKIIASFF